MMLDWLKINFTDLMIVLVGSAFGFIFALVVAVIATKAQRHFRIKTMRNNLEFELNLMYMRINASNFLWSTPIWNSLISTGDLLLLKKKDEDYYTSVQLIYSEIHVLDQAGASLERNRPQIQGVKERIEELLRIAASTNSNQ